MHTRFTRSLAALGVVLAVAVATPTVGAAPRHLPPDRATALPAKAAQPRWGDFVAATDTALLLTQPDGTELRARMTDAEIGGALEVDGYSIVKGRDGWWRYASRLSANGLEASSLRAGVDKRTRELRPGVGRTEYMWSDGRGGDVRSQLLRQLQAASREASMQAAAGGGPRVFKFPVVLFATWWDEEEGQTSPQFQEGNDVAHYEAILDGFGGNPTGTLTEFYFENSYGQFLVEVDVLAQPDGSPYVSTRSMEDRCYYGGIDASTDPVDDLDPLDNVLPGGGGALGMAVEAFNTTSLPVDHQFADYDNDGDGSIDFMGIIHTGAEMAVTGDPCNTWSHAISVSTFTSIAGAVLQDMGLPVPDTGFKAGLPVPGQAVTYDRLFTMPEFETENGILTIGVAAHEMAHALGEPDYYGTDGSSSGSGDWDIMSGGSYGGTPSGSNPTWFNPATRVFQHWVTPTIVHEDEVGYTLERRSKMPLDGYTVGQENPNLVLVPTRWVQVGDETDDGHVWTEDDVAGMVEDGDNGFVIEGWYLEFASRMPVKAPAIHPGMTRESYFDRWLYGSGLLTWHFDYWRRSQVLTGQNGANNDPNRMQMDVEEWDFNDNTQEIALNLNRAEASDVAWNAATGITSGTHRVNPDQEAIPAGEPQEAIDLGPGPVAPAAPADFEFTVDANPANYTMTVEVVGVGDCTLQLLYGPAGEEVEQTEVVDAGFVGTPESTIVTKPKPGRWVARVGDFAACGLATGSVAFEGRSGFDAKGTADTWMNESEEPSGWAFTNIRTGGGEGLSHGSDAGGDDSITLDIVDLSERTDVSPGFALPAENGVHGRSPLVAGEDNAMEVRVFNNGSDVVEGVDVEVHIGSPTGPVVGDGTVNIDGFDSEVFGFDFDPGHEGQVDLYTVVDADGDEIDNNVQKSTLWAGPQDPSVLIVDDDGPGDTEQVYAGALAALGIPYAIAERHVSAEEMSGYDAVVWVSTLDRYQGQLDPADRGQIASYLDEGGKLWLSSNRAIEALLTSEAAGDTGAVAFGANYFGVTSADIDSFYNTVQFEMDDILPDKTVDIDVLPGRPFVDKYELVGAPEEEGDPEVFGSVTGLGVLQGSGTAASPGDGEAILGARVEGDEEHGGFQTVANTFSLSQIRQPGDAIDIVGSVMGHFGVQEGQYTVESEDPIVYHSQARQTVANVELPIKAIVLGGAEGQPVSLFYRHHSLGSYVEVAMQASGDRGGYLRLIPAADVTPDGLDYYLKAGSASTYEPTTSQGSSVANAVAVYMPDAAAPAPEPAPEPGPEPRTASAPAPEPDSGAQGGGQTLPATGAQIFTGVAGALVLGGLGLRRLTRGS